MMAHKLGCSYKEAMMNPKTKATYKKGGKMDFMHMAEMAKPHVMPYLKSKHPRLANLMGGSVYNQFLIHYAKKHNMTLKQAMKDAKAKEEYKNIKIHSLSSSHPHLRKHIKTIKGGAVRSSDISHLTNKELKHMLKERGMKLTKKVDGKYSPYTKNEMIKLLAKDKKKHAQPRKGLEMTAYASAPQEFDDAPQSAPTVEESYRVIKEIKDILNSELPSLGEESVDDVIKLLQSLLNKGGKIHRMKKARKWMGFSEDAVNKGIDLGSKIKSTFF